MRDFFDELPIRRGTSASGQPGRPEVPQPPQPQSSLPEVSFPDALRPEPDPRRFVLVVAADASPTSGHVIRSAAALARIIPGAELHIVHVLTDVEPGAPLEPARTASDPSLDRGLAQLSELALQAHEACPAHVVPHVCAGDPAREILQLAANLDADLVVVGARSGHGLRRLVLGSVAEKVVRRSRCPVFVTRPKAADLDEGARLRAPAQV